MKILVVTNMYPNPKQPAFGTFVKDQVEDLRQHGVEVEVLFINGRQNRLNYLWGVFRFWKRVITNRYDLIHAHYALSGVIARLQWWCPVVVTYHGVEVLSIHSTHWLTNLSRWMAPFFERVIVVAQAEKDILQRPNVVVIPCAVDLERFHPIPRQQAREQLQLPPDKPLVLWAGEPWRYQKRFELVEAAMQIVKQHCPEAELVLVSGQPHEVIPLYMNACDVLVLTSRFEGSPMVVKEAMACNLPVVSTPVGDVPDVIGGVEGCYLVPPDAEEVAQKLLQVLQRRQRTRGRDAIRHLGNKPITQRLLKLYNELCPPHQRIPLEHECAGAPAEQPENEV
ncbi:MAG: glycosyltransferase family 4 protein [Caldilineae bacterium]|nr:MAG: glycosyltransferase family 4 protein [Caldilineae bacterium]